ncbi:MAG: glycosyltransferase [Acidiferrobacterales bacterium]
MYCKVSVVIPTYKEVKNIPHITRAVSDALSAAAIDFEIIFVDDNSADGSEAAVEKLASNIPVRIIVRKNERGLSTAVVCGIEQATGEFVVVMDADLSHPADRIPEMINKLESGQNDFIVGSRYIKGGSLDESWGFFRRFNSLVATWLALPLAHIRDPMSGFFAFRRNNMPETYRLSPIGYKIGLELVVKGEFKQPGEVAIHFVDRQYGESKLSWQEQVKYLRHLRRLYQFRFPFLSEFFQFAFVGATGFVIDLSLYLAFQSLFGIQHIFARGLSFWGAVSWNWAWNRVLTFSNRKKTRKRIQWPAFVLTSLVGFAFNWGTYFILTKYVPFFQAHHILALIVGVLIGLGLNFTFARLLVFRPFEDEIHEDDSQAWSHPNNGK